MPARALRSDDTTPAHGELRRVIHRATVGRGRKRRRRSRRWWNVAEVDRGLKTCLSVRGPHAPQVQGHPLRPALNPSGHALFSCHTGPTGAKLQQPLSSSSSSSDMPSSTCERQSTYPPQQSGSRGSVAYRGGAGRACVGSGLLLELERAADADVDVDAVEAGGGG